MSRLNITSLEIPDVKLIEYKVIEDNRGSFSEIFNIKELSNSGITFDCFQENHTVNRRGVVRGLHSQIYPYCQEKIVECVHGRIFDVAVDVRTGSPWFGKWCGTYLSGTDNYALLVPIGFLHGFCTIEEGSIVNFKCSGQWNLEYERAVKWDDPTINIQWPIPHCEIIVSEREMNRGSFNSVQNWFTWGHRS